MQLELKQYPSAIAASKRKALNMEQDIRLLKESLLRITTEADQQIAEESKQKLLTNDQQRKTRKQELLDSNLDHAMCQRKLQQAQDDLEELNISIDLLCAEFSIFKLEMRQRIAQMEQATALAA